MHNASRKKRRLPVLLFFILFLSTPAFAQKGFRVLEKTPEHVTVRFSFPAITSNPDSIAAAYKNAGFAFIKDGDNPLSPAAVYYLPEMAGIAGWKILEMVEQDLPRGAEQSLLEVLAGLDSSAASAQGRGGRRDLRPYPPQPVALKTLGRVRSHELRALYVFPWQIRNKEQVRALQSVTVRLQMDRGVVIADSLLFATTPKNLLLAAPRGRSRNPKVSQTAISEANANIAQVKIRVRRDGLFKVTYEDLQAAGVETPVNLDSWDLRLSSKGVDEPIFISDGNDRIFGPGDYIEFYGEFSRAVPNPDAPDVYLDEYSQENIYWLEWGHGRGQIMNEEEGLVLETDPAKYRVVYSFPATVHYEKDAYYDRLSQYQGRTPRDHWFLDNGVFSSEKRDYTVELPNPDRQSDMDVMVRIMLHGQTFDASTGPHTIEAFFNQRLALRGTWFNQTLYELRPDPEQPIRANALLRGKNTLGIVNRAPANSIDNVLVNWIEVTYPRLMVADSGKIEFTVPKNMPRGLFDFTIANFTSSQISIYKLGASKIIGADVVKIENSATGVTYRVHFQDAVFSDNVRYVAVQEDAKLKPYAIEMHTPVDLHDLSLAADYIVIAYDSLAESNALQSLVQHRESQGHRVLVVPSSEVFNQFSYGLFSPYGIRDFLRYAYFNWSTPPKYVLLVGDGSYDNRDLVKLGTNLIPVFARPMLEYGAAVSDHWYSLMNPEDELPDLFLGRLPVNTEDELAAVVAKIIEYETMTEKDAWLNRLMLIGGNGMVFRQQTEELIRNVLPTRLEINRLYTYRDPDLQDDPFFGGTSELIDNMNDGLFLLNFMGHGGGAIWADNSLLRLEDVDRLENKGKYPIVTSMTCFTGAFDSPQRQTLSERMLLLPEAGSQAIWASSGLGWRDDDFRIVREFFDLLAQFGDNLTLGEYLAVTKVQYVSKYLTPTAFSIINQYNLLGDPALRLQLPGRKLPLTLGNPLPQIGDTTTVSGSVQFPDGFATIQVVDETRQAVFSTDVQVENSRFQKIIEIPTSLSGQRGWFRAYAKSGDGSQHVSSSREFSLNRIWVDTLYADLGAPTYADSVRFFARIAHANPLVQIETILSYPAADTLLMILNPKTQMYESARKLPPLPPLAVIRFELRVQDQAGNAYRSPVLEVRRPAGPELAVLPNYLRLAGTGHIELQTYAFNLGDAAAQNVVVRFEQLVPGTQQWRWIGSDTLDIPQKDRRYARIPFIPQPGQITIRSTIDPENRFRERQETNNSITESLDVEIFRVTRAWGTTLSDARNDTIAFDSVLRLFVEPEQVSADVVMQVKYHDARANSNQPDFEQVFAGGRALAYDLSLLDSLGTLSISDMRIAFRVDSLLVDTRNGKIPLLNAANAAICRFDAAIQKWVKISSQKDEHALISTVPVPGQYGVFLIHDSEPPRVEFSIEGQLFSSGGFVPPRPVVGISAFDMNGVNRSESGIKVWVDDVPWPFAQLSFVDSAASVNATSIQFRPDFTSGTHIIRVQVQDAAGNVSEPVESQFNVSEEKIIRFLGNYPNPFRVRTVFAYELTDHAEELDLKIFTTSGHLIRTIRAEDVVEDPNPLGPNYHEISWDGRDTAGESVANGMYYFKLRVKFRDKTTEQVGRVARLR